jgi:5-methylcytosine-specific restriction endonuclease McrA
MRAYSLTHLSDDVLLRELAGFLARDRVTTAALLARIAEVDQRRLHVPAGYPTMFAHCVGGLHLSEDATDKRIQAARAARRFPVLFAALADGRLHQTAIRLLAPHLTAENVDELVAAATHQRKSVIESLIAQRFAQVAAIVAAARVPSAPPAPPSLSPAPYQVNAHVAPPAEVPPPPPALAPTSPPPAAGRIRLHVTIDGSTRDKLHRAQALLSHAIPSGDVAQVLDRALDALIRQLEKRKFAATDRPPATPRQPRTRRLAGPGERAVPAHVRRAVWERDGGQCTFVGTGGHRCGSTRLLEFDHVDPVARGGQATVDRMRLRCRAHNQYEAEKMFGADFMQARRDGSRRQRASGGDKPPPSRDDCVVRDRWRMMGAP